MPICYGPAIRPAVLFGSLALVHDRSVTIPIYAVVNGGKNRGECMGGEKWWHFQVISAKIALFTAFLEVSVNLTVTALIAVPIPEPSALDSKLPAGQATLITHRLRKYLTISNKLVSPPPNSAL